MTTTNEAFIPGTLIHTPTEVRRLDDLIAYNSTILAHMSGPDLDRALRGEVPRRNRTDASMRRIALETMHPDDLAMALVSNGFTLASVGIESIALRLE